MRLYKIIALISLGVLLMLQAINTGCSKPPDTPPPVVDSIPPPPPVPDTISLVKKLEVLTSLYPGYGIEKYRTYSFYYDGQKRLTAVGIKNYSIISVDTFTTKLEYNGNSNLPSRIIMPDINASLLPNPASYDTTWFYYNANGKLLKDSTYERWFGGTARRPLYRNYSYPNAFTVKIDWFWAPSLTLSPVLKRRDTISLAGNGNPHRFKAVYVEDPATAEGGYGVAQDFTYSQVVNPLSKLNISATPYSILYTNVKKEMLGNSSHPVVYNSNGFADYLDFVSPVIPNIFYIFGYTRYHQTLGQGAATFTIQITPWTVRPSYPAEIRVTISTSLVGDKYIYRYSY